MQRVRYTADGGHYRVGGYGFDPGDEKTVDEDLAEYLADTNEFDVVDESGGSDTNESTDESEQTGDDSADNGFDIAGFLDRNVDPVVDDVRAGAVDEHLDDIAEQADRVTVSDAIGERRAELEG